MGKKGKAHGRAGQKKKAQKASHGTPRSSPWTQDFTRGKNSLLYDDSEDDEFPRTAFKGFTGASPRIRASFDPNIKLRHRTIAFVSAGTNTPAEVEQAEEVDVQIRVEPPPSEGAGVQGQGVDQDDDIDDSNIQTNILVTLDEGVPHTDMENLNISQPAPSQPTQPQPPLFVVDTVGDENLAQTFTTKTQLRDPSPTRSDSSEEIVFVGRTKPSTTAPFDSQVQPRPRHWTTATESPVPNATSADERGWSNQENKAPGSPPLEWEAYKQKQRASQQEPARETWVPAPSVPYWKTGGQYNGSSPAAASQPRSTIPDVMLEIANVETSTTATRKELEAEWKRVLQEKKSRKTISSGNRQTKRSRKQSNRMLRGENMMDSDEGLSEAAYEDYMENLAAQLDAEDLEAMPQLGVIAGPSMMVDGKEYDDDEVLDATAHSEEISIDSSEESDHKRIGLDYDGGSGEEDSEWADDSSELEDELEYTERQQWEDEADLRQRRLEAKTDEQLAKLWAKQIELGIEGDELVIDDGEYDSGQFGDLDAARAGLHSVDSSRSKSSKRRGKSTGLSFPNASALADTLDQYGDVGFDIMDFDRPSLRPTKRGRKSQLPPEIEAMSDEEGFKNDLAVQWDRDRHKKKLKKLEREELRAQGLLGSAGKKGLADLGQKYRDGMTLAQIKVELHTFLHEGGETRAFPPMGKKDRKQLHEVVSALGLKSKSLGSGKNRFPLVSKTRITSYDDDDFERVFHRASRGQLSVLGNRGRAKMAAGRGRGGGFDKSAGTLRNGEVVGADAPEIADTSFGHRLMEKMGWSKGTALGKDGEGRLVPVEQIMRTGKAGLG